MLNFNNQLSITKITFVIRSTKCNVQATPPEFIVFIIERVLNCSFKTRTKDRQSSKEICSMISSLQRILCCCHKGGLIWARKGSRTNGFSSCISQITFKLYKYVLGIILCYQISISLYVNPAEFCSGHINLCLFLFAVMNQKSICIVCWNMTNDQREMIMSCI